MSINPRLETLPDFPFDRLRNLLDGVSPPDNVSPISLAVGEPQQPVPSWVADSVHDHTHRWNNYPPFAGTPELRAAIAGWLDRRFGLGPNDLDPQAHILACAGSREALYLLSTWLVPETKNGKRPIVAMPNPFYHVYGTGALASGAEPLFLSATRETGFLPDLGALDGATLERLSILFLCSPANPQGAIATTEYLKHAIRLAREHDFVVVSDECYAEIYDHTPPPGALQVCRGMGACSNGSLYDRVIAVNSLSKRSNGAGLRSGFVAGDPTIIEGFGQFRSYIAASIPLPIDAASVALWNDDCHVDGVRAYYRRNIDVAEAVIGDRFGFYRPQGGFFLWLHVGDGEAAAKTLWREAGVKVLPGVHTSREDPYGSNPGTPYIRIALVNDEIIIRTACERLVKVL